MKSFVIGGLAAFLLVGSVSAQDMMTAAKPGAPEPPCQVGSDARDPAGSA